MSYRRRELRDDLEDAEFARLEARDKLRKARSPRLFRLSGDVSVLGYSEHGDRQLELEHAAYELERLLFQGLEISEDSEREFRAKFRVPATPEE